MPPRYLALLLIAPLLALAPDARAARVLDVYDTDSLVAMSELIVKGQLGDATDVHTRDGDCAVWDVTVLSTFLGDAKPQSVIRVAGIEEYKKGPGIPDVPDKTYPRLSRGDVVYLFLVPKGAREGYAKYLLTNADWKVIESGARLVVNDSVHSFGQYDRSSPIFGLGPSGFVARTTQTAPEAPVPSVEAFEKQVRTSIKFVSDLRRKIATTGLTDTERADLARSRAAVKKRELTYDDHIPTLLFTEPRQPTTRPETRR
jgi:hypothetical protein